MSHAHQMTDAAQVKKFVLAGDARFTLVSTQTGKRFTYRVRAKIDETLDTIGQAEATPAIWFVSLLTGSDNENDYQYLGFIRPNMRYLHGTKSKIGAQAPSARAFAYVWELLAGFNRMPAEVEIWHEGMCGRCGRALTVPESIESGFGPECAKHI